MESTQNASPSTDATGADGHLPEIVGSFPVIMAPQPDGADVVWSVTGPARGWVEWVESDQDPTGSGPGPGEWLFAERDDFGFVPQGEEVLRVRLRGWRPGTRYLIRTHTVSTTDRRQAISAWKQVRTLDPEAPSTTFVVWNDTHQRDETLARLDDAAPGGDFFVWNGDICNNWNDSAELVPTILTPAERDITRGRPLCFVWGNHDVRGRYAYRVPRIIATPDNRPYYAIRSGPVAAIFLNTGEDKPDDHPTFEGRVAFEQLRREQAAWLERTIIEPEIADAPYRLVFCHIPLRWQEEPILTDADYADGAFDHYSQPGRPLWHEALVEWGAQLIISGHTHDASWIPASEQFPYAQLTGGAPASWAATWIEGHADAESLTVTTRRLDTSVRHQVSLNPCRPTDTDPDNRSTVGTGA